MIVESMDVFLTNLRPFELERYRMEYETLNRLNPRLVAGFLPARCCSVGDYKWSGSRGSTPAPAVVRPPPGLTSVKGQPASYS